MWKTGLSIENFIFGILIAELLAKKLWILNVVGKDENMSLNSNYPT